MNDKWNVTYRLSKPHDGRKNVSTIKARDERARLSAVLDICKCKWNMNVNGICITDH